MNVFNDIRTLVTETLDAMVAEGRLPNGLSWGPVTVEPPRDAGHGDMATNAAMVLAKPAGMQPRDIAGELAARLLADPRVEAAEVAGPGFLNLRLAPQVWHDVVTRGDRRRARLRPFRHGRGREGERRIRLARTRPGRSTWATRAARSSATRWRGCWPSRATRSRGSTTSTTAARRSRCWRARPTSATARPAGMQPEIARGALSRRLPDPGGRGAEGEVRRKPARQAANRTGWRRCASSRPRR